MTLYYKENKQIGLDNYNKIISIHYISIINDYKVMYTNNFIYRSKIFMRYIILYLYLFQINMKNILNRPKSA